MNPLKAIKERLNKKTWKPYFAQDACSILATEAMDYATNHIVTISRNATLQAAAQLMAQEGISTLVVESQHALAGILTEAEISRCSLLHDSSLTVKDAKLEPVKMLNAHSTVLEAYLLMSRIDATTVVLHRDHNPVAVLSIVDLCRIIDMLHDLPLQYPPLIKHIVNKEFTKVKNTDDLATVRRHMEKNNSDAALVYAKDKLVGYIDAKDLTMEISMSRKVPSKRQVRLIMTNPIISITPDKNVFEANHLIMQQKIRHLVVTENGKNIGMVTHEDIAHAMYSYLIDMKCLIQPTKET